MKTVEVQVTKSYYKSTTMNVEVPEHLTDDEIHTYVEQQENKTSELSDALADASLNSDGNMEIEILTF